MKFETIGEAYDGAAGADGATILTFRQAQEKARTTAEAIAKGLVDAAAGPVVTVRQAVDDYLATREVRERKQKGDGAGLRRDPRSSLINHVLNNETLASKPLGELTSDDIKKMASREA